SSDVCSSDLEYFKVKYGVNYYLPLDRQHNWVLRLRSEIGFGDGYGDSNQLPFFENYYAGGFASVRGYRANSLGMPGTPSRYSSDDDEPLGGNLLRSEEHTSELQSRENLVCRLLLEKKKTHKSQ